MTVHEPCPLFRVSLCTIHPVPTPATVAPSSPRTSVLWRMSASGGIEMKKLCFRDCGWWVGCTDRKVRLVFVWSPQTDASRSIGSICEWGVVIVRDSSKQYSNCLSKIPVDVKKREEECLVFVHHVIPLTKAANNTTVQTTTWKVQFTEPPLANVRDAIPKPLNQ